MKKRFFFCLLCLCMIVTFSFMLTSCNNDDDDDYSKFINLDGAVIKNFDDYVAFGAGAVNSAPTSRLSATSKAPKIITCAYQQNSNKGDNFTLSYLAESDVQEEEPSEENNFSQPYRTRFIGLKADGTYEVITFELTTTINKEDGETITETSNTDYSLSNLKMFNNWCVLAYTHGEVSSLNTQFRTLNVYYQDGVCMIYLLNLTNGKLYSMENFTSLSMDLGEENVSGIEISMESENSIYFRVSTASDSGLSLYRFSINDEGNLVANEVLSSEQICKMNGGIISGSGFSPRFVDKYDQIAAYRASDSSFGILRYNDNDELTYTVCDPSYSLTYLMDNSIYRLIEQNETDFQILTPEGEWQSTPQIVGYTYNMFDTGLLGKDSFVTSGVNSENLRTETYCKITPNECVRFIYTYNTEGTIKSIDKTVYASSSSGINDNVPFSTDVTEIVAMLKVVSDGVMQFRLYMYDNNATGDDPNLYYYLITDTTNQKHAVAGYSDYMFNSISVNKESVLTIFGEHNSIVGRKLTLYINNEGTVSETKQTTTYTVFVITPLN
jgi:hypothetical protein